MKKQPVLITDAARSQDDQYRSRQIRYVTMMSARAACLIIGAVLVSVHPPWLGLWLVLCAAGMVFLPWFAVLIANFLTQDGESNWFEGVQLLALYIVFGLVFFYA